MKALPRSYEQAVRQIVGTLSEKDKATVRAVPGKQDMIRFHHGWGTGLRNEFGLWSGNEPLLRSCTLRAGLDANVGLMHPDDASALILEGVWEALREGAPPASAPASAPRKAP